MSQPQQEHLQGQMWGFLSTCVTGSAAVFFKKALKLNGLHAWRVIVRMIVSGADHQLERLRDEVRAITRKPITDLEHVATGIAEYEAKILEFKEAGGIGFSSSQEMKSDMRKLLPQRIREDLIWMEQGKKAPFEEFRDKVIDAAAEILFHRRHDGVHAVEEPEEPTPASASWQEEGLDFNEGITLNSMDDLVAVVNRYQQGRGKGSSAPRGAQGAVTRPPRQCVNCGKTHEGKCTASELPRDQRPCWTCCKPGCISATCPLKVKGGSKGGGKGGGNRSAVKAVGDALLFFGIPGGQIAGGEQAAVRMCTDGFQAAKETFKPTP
jgi:hypothetical protein